MYEVLRAIHTENKPDQVAAHHQQDVEDTTSRTQVAIPPRFSKLRRKGMDFVNMDSFLDPAAREE